MILPRWLRWMGLALPAALLALPAAAADGSASGLAEVREADLANGLRVLVARTRPPAGLAEMLLVAAAGSDREEAGEEGAAWLTAHALFAGPAPGGDGSVGRALALQGAEVEIEVGREWAVFHLVMPADRAAAVIATLAALLDRPRLPAAAWSEARESQRQRLDRQTVDPLYQGEQLLARLTWGPGPAPAAGEEGGAPAAGRLAAAGRARDAGGAERFRQRTYGAVSLVLAVWGDLSPARMEAAVRRGFTPLPAGSSPPRRTAAAPASPRPASATAFHCLPADGLVPPLLLVGRATAAPDERSFYGWQALAYILGGSHSSRLLRRLRGEEPLAYSVDAGSLPVAAGGRTLRVTCQTAEVERSRAVIEEELERLARQEVGGEELGIAVAILKSRALLEREAVRARLLRQAKEHLSPGAVRDPGRAGPILDALTPGDLLALARGQDGRTPPATVLLTGQPLELCRGHWRDARTLR